MDENETPQIYSNREVADAPSDGIPAFISNPTDQPYQKRADAYFDAKTNISSVEWETTTTFDVNTAGVGGVTLEHNLGYTPFPIGAYEILASTDSAFPAGRVGMIPETRRSDFIFGINNGVYFKIVDEKRIGVSVLFTSTGITSIRAHILLLRQPAI